MATVTTANLTADFTASTGANTVSDLTLASLPTGDYFIRVILGIGNNGAGASFTVMWLTTGAAPGTTLRQIPCDQQLTSNMPNATAGAPSIYTFSGYFHFASTTTVNVRIVATGAAKLLRYGSVTNEDASTPLTCIEAVQL